MPVKEHHATELESAGDPEGALKAWTMLGRFEEAARLAFALGRPLEAAELSWHAGLFYEAGVCSAHAGEPLRALACFVRVPSQHPRYREACVAALGPSVLEHGIDAVVEDWLRPWYEHAPTNPAESTALIALARWYAAREVHDVAAHALKKIPAFDPAIDEARALLTAGYEGRPLADVPSTNAGIDVDLDDD